MSSRVAGAAPRRAAAARVCGAAASLVCALVAAAASAAPEPVVPPDEAPPSFEEQLERLRGQDLDGMTDDPTELEATLALAMGRLVRARELAEEMLRDHPDSFVGHCVLGKVQAFGEGNSPLAVYHLERCRDLFEARYGRPHDEDPWLWHRAALEALVDVTSDMGRYEEALGHVDQLDADYGGDHRHLRCWPLVNLRRHDEAREIARQIIEDSDDPDQLAIAWNALCVAAGEERDNQVSYEACQVALELARDGSSDPTRFTNAAEAAASVLRMDEVEKLLLEGTRHFRVGTVAMPWAELVHLYLDQGRAPEALAAMREMFAWRNRQPPYIDVHNWSIQDLASATLLLVVGRPVEAARLTGRALERPDRMGRNSIDPEQMRAATALYDRAANLAAAELLAEEAASSDFFWDGLRAHLAALRHRLRAWRSGRAAAASFSSWRLLSSRVQPHSGGFARIPEWIDSDLTQLLGAGVMEAAMARAQASGLVTGERGYLQALAAEIALARSNYREGAALADEALRRLPRFEALLRARVAVLGARAALALSDLPAALSGFELAFQLDPGTIRRQGAAIPTRFEGSDGAVARDTIRRLRRSPRLDPAASGFVVRVDEGPRTATACLSGPFGTVLSCASITPRAGETATDQAQRLAWSFHETAFAPRVDLTQADLRSLDGSNAVASERGSERLRLVLGDLVDEK